MNDRTGYCPLDGCHRREQCPPESRFTCEFIEFEIPPDLKRKHDMTTPRFTSNNRPMDYSALRPKPPVWKTPVGVGTMAVVIIGSIAFLVAML